MAGLLAIVLSLVGISFAAFSTQAAEPLQICIKKGGQVYIVGTIFRLENCRINGSTPADKLITINPNGSAIGPQGEKGDTGEAGPPGPQGIQGEIGSPGPAGAPGAAGLKGDTGDKGDAGTPGIQGEQGVAGDIGPQGPIGANGMKGDQGPQGVPGERGDQGEQGIQGIQGEVGSAGPQGDIGAFGPQGPAGEQGDPGPQGPTGTNGVSGWEKKILASATNTEVDKTVTVFCPEDKKVLGGGALASSNLAYVYENYPSADNAWTVSAHKSSLSWALTAYAICVTAN